MIFEKKKLTKVTIKSHRLLKKKPLETNFVLEKINFKMSEMDEAQRGAQLFIEKQKKSLF